MNQTHTITIVRRIFVPAALLVVLAAVSCGSSDTGGAGGQGGAGASSGSDGTTTTAGGCTTAAECDDGFSCTIDICTGGSCTHTVGPNSGPTACPSGTFCEPMQGCIAAPACATDAQCALMWKNDACKTEVKCDPVTSLCTFTVLDKDGDGHPPQVCGGDDCDDNDPDRFPGNPEVCDGKDNDCNGKIDDGLDMCGGQCVDKLNDPMNCGACGNVCPSGPDGYCANGTCACLSFPEVVCGTSCVRTDLDHDNCGACGKACGLAQECDGSVCTCPFGTGEACGPNCIDTTSDPQNCGACSHACVQGASCQAGACGPCPPGKPNACGNACVDLTKDGKNCGACGKVCAVDEICVAGACSQCPLDAPTPCNGKCSDFNTDSTNCGSCGGVQCDTSNYEVCSYGMCAGQAACGACDGTTDCCFDCPTDLKTDTANCGSCGHFCNVGDVCSGGVCQACVLFDTCKSCCDKQHESAFWIHGKALYPGCACAAGAPCAAACQDPAANVCQDPALSPMDSCVACLRAQWTAGAACAAPAIQKCAADPLCSPVTSCFATCP